MGTTGDAGGICSRLCESVPCGVRGVIRLVFAIWICVYLNLAVAVCVSWPRGMWVWIRSAARFMRANWRRWSADPSQMKIKKKRKIVSPQAEDSTAQRHFKCQKVLQVHDGEEYVDFGWPTDVDERRRNWPQRTIIACFCCAVDRLLKTRAFRLQLDLTEH